MDPSKAARAALMLARPKRALGGTMPYGDSALPIVSDGPPTIGSKPKMLGALPGQSGGGGGGDQFGGILNISDGGGGEGAGGNGSGNSASGGNAAAGTGAAASGSSGTGTAGDGDGQKRGGRAVRAALMLAKRPKRADGGGVPLLPERPDVAQYRAMDPDARDAWKRDRDWRSSHPRIIKPGDPQRDANFKEWFGDSKIVDRTGAPLRAYHISNKNFTRFIPGGSYNEREHESGPATWLSPYPDRQPAGHHVGGYEGNFKPGTHVMPLHVSMKNPLVLDHRAAMDRAKEILGDTHRGQFPLMLEQAQINRLQEAGHDGIIYAGSNAVLRDEPAYQKYALGEHPDHSEEIISFRPQRQLKSAIGNTGRYNRQDNDINYADGGSVASDPDLNQQGRYSHAGGAVDATRNDVNGAYPPVLKDYDDFCRYLDEHANCDPDSMEGAFHPDTQFRLSRVPLKDIKLSNHSAAHAPETDRVDRYSKRKAATAPPVLLDENGVLLDGHHRYYAARARGDEYHLAYRPMSGRRSRADGGAAEAQRPPDAYFDDLAVGTYPPLNFENLIKSGAARITQPGDGRGGHTASDDPEQWSLVSHANDTSPDSVTRSWPDKSASYENAARVLNEPGALYDGKYRQLVWSARQRGMTDKDIYVPSERHPQPRTAYADGGSIGHNGGPTMDAPPAMDAPSDLNQQGLYSQPAFAKGGSVDKALRLTRADGGPIPPTAPAPGVSVVPDDHPAVAQAKQILNQPTKSRVIKDPEYPISSVIARGVPLNPRNPHPTADQVVAARADDRVGGMAVNKRLDTIVPERERVAGGTYTPGAPGGGRWADATIDVGEAVPTGSDPFPIDTSEYRHESRSEKLVDQPGKGFKITDNELQRLWDESVSESSQAAKNAANAHNVKPTFSAQDWDQAMRLPLRDHLWYELSGEKLAENLPDLTAKQHMKFLDLVGATSARAKPDENLERSLATMSQHMRGVPIDIDLTQPAAVRTALSREGQDTSALPGNKTGHFSDTLALTGGVPTRFPISVNDVWVGKMFGIPDDVMSQNQSLHEPMAKYFNKLRDAYNQRMDPPFQYQSWNFQAPAWVHLRGQQSAAESGDAYHQVWGKTLDKLRRAGVEGIVGDKITKQALMDPKFADALRRTTKPFRDAPKATVEFGSTQTSAGKRAHDLYQTAIARGDDLSQKEYLSGLTTAMYQSGRGKNHPWERLKKALTGDMGVSGDITRIESPTTEAPLDIGGTFEGAVSPNIRVPLKGMSDRKISHFNGIAGKHLRQDAMAVSTVHDAVPDSEPAENATRGHSIFVPTTEGMDPRHIREFAKEMSTQGHDMSYNRYPNGYRFDVLPKFEDSGPVGVTERQLDDAYEKTLQRHYGTGMIAPHDFKSVYNPASDYAGLRKEALGDIRDEFIQQATAAGLTKGAAARAASAKKPPSDLTGRGKRAWDAYRARLDHLAEAEKGFKELAQRVTDAHVKFVGKAEKRFQKPAPTSDPDAPPFARGGVVDPYKHARRVVSTAGRYSRGGGSGKTDERSVVDRALQLTSKGYRK